MEDCRCSCKGKCQCPINKQRYPSCCLKPCNRLNSKFAMIGRDLCINPCLVKKIVNRGSIFDPIIVGPPPPIIIDPIIPQPQIGVNFGMVNYISHPNLAPQNHPPLAPIAHPPFRPNSTYLTVAGVSVIKPHPVLSPLHQP